VFDSYRNKYENVRMKRVDGVLEVALHSGGGPLVFNGYVHEALVGAFRDIGDDPENHVVILTGTGDEFCAQITPDGFDFFTRDTTRSSARVQRPSRTFSTSRSR